MNTHIKQRGLVWLEQVLQDIRFSLRMLRRNPGFTAIAVISLALAIGVNAGVFSIVNAMLFKPIFPLRLNEVVSVYTHVKENYGEGYGGFTLSEFSLLQESDEVFAEVSGYREMLDDVLVSANAEMRKREAIIVSDNYFSMLGLKPSMGRFFLPEESRPNANIPVAVVSRSLWESIGGGNDFSERTVKIKGKIYDVVGVVPKGFSGTTSLVAPEVWLPMGMAASFVNMPIPGLEIADNLRVSAIARLQPGLTLEATKSRLTVLAPRLSAMEVDTADKIRTLEIGPLSRFNLHSAGPSDEDVVLEFVCALMIGIAGVVLLVACLNLANLFLARNTTRSDELSVRLALGASRWRVVRILSVEGLIIALIGGVAGLVLSHWANGLLLGSLTRFLSLFSMGASWSLDATPDIRVLMATLLFCVTATLVFALAPAWHATRDMARGSFSLQRSTRTATDRWGRLFSGRHCLLMAQLALSLILLFSAGSLLGTAISAVRPDLGFEPEGNLVAEIDYSLVDRDEASIQNSIAALEDALRAFPGVQKVALASDFPFENYHTDSMSISTVGDTGKQERQANDVDWTAVSRGYFDVLGIKLLRGRDFTEQECLQAEGPSIVIIDQGTASALFPGEDPVGKYILLRGMGMENGSPLGLIADEDPPEPMEISGSPPPEAGQAKTFESMQIVGVVSAHRDDVIADSPPLRLFFPLSKYSKFSWQRSIYYVLMRGQTTEAAASGAFRELVRSKLLGLDPDIPLVRLTPYPDILAGDIILWELRFAAVLFGICSAIALLLAVIGVYGVNAFLAARRMREIGIRMALGASRRRIYSLLMKQGAVLIAIGLGVGLMLSLIGGKLLAILFLRIPLGDPLMGALVALLLALAALLAIWIPARRAAKVDPMEVLRWE